MKKLTPKQETTMSEIKFNCPACGTELTVSAAETHNCGPQPSTVQIDELHVHIPGVTRSNRAQAKIEALRAAGVNVSNLFSMQGADGSDVLVRRKGGFFQSVPDDDPIFAAIITGKTVPNRRLFRRWVMAQMFHMLTQKRYGEYRPMGFTEALNQKGYKYSWEMTVEEFRVQAKLFINDKENFAERNRWFNKEVAIAMAEHYIVQLENHIKTLKKRKCKGVPYVHLYKRDIFVSDLPAKVYRPLYHALDNIRGARTPQNLYSALAKFHSEIKKTWLAYGTPQSPAFKDAYKGVGAFYTLKNLILFHGYVFPTAPTANLSMVSLYGYMNDKALEGYKMLGILKEFLETNHINIEAKMAEWRK